MRHLAFFAHTNVFHHGGLPVSIELSIASTPEDLKYQEVICLMVAHSNPLTNPKNSRANHYINERIYLKDHLPGSMPLDYPFCVMGKFCHLSQRNRGLIIVKGADQRKFFETLGLLQSTW
ncbi:hypothetical protein TNCV_1368411 [Trichonephila clavipes]|nr:hypothetical protein TNCV_1368411 [Trichonephila clavipes]